MNMAVRMAADAADARIDEDWGGLTWLASQELGNAVGLTLGRVVIKAGMSNPRHSHATALGDEDADMIVAYSSGNRDFQPEP